MATCSFDAASRGRYSTDASIYQVEPVGVVVPRTPEAARGRNRDCDRGRSSVLARGAGSSQCGQTVGASLVIDHSKHLRNVLELDPAQRSVVVEPGITLDALNAQLRPHNLWFPVDVSTSAQATLGGMAGNNSCGSRSIAYGNMVHNVLAIEALTAAAIAGGLARWQRLPARRGTSRSSRSCARCTSGEREEIAARFPKVLRKVAGYNLDHLGPPHANAAPPAGRLRGNARLVRAAAPQALAAAARTRARGLPLPEVLHRDGQRQHIVQLGPSAVELVDRTMIGLAREIGAYARTVEQFIRGEPDAVLLVEFSGDDPATERARLRKALAVDGGPWPPGKRRRDQRRAAAEGDLGGQEGGPQHHDVDEGGRQARLVHRGLCGAARAPCRVHRAAHRGVSQARHARHLVRARLGRHAARAAGARHAARRRAEDARDRRGSVRDGEGIQGRLLGASTATGWCAPSGSRPSSARA
jgi:FAD/FMN-containing dehydrogenase